MLRAAVILFNIVLIAAHAIVIASAETRAMMVMAGVVLLCGVVNVVVAARGYHTAPPETAPHYLTEVANALIALEGVALIAGKQFDPEFMRAGLSLVAVGALGYKALHLGDRKPAAADENTDEEDGQDGDNQGILKP